MEIFDCTSDELTALRVKDKKLAAVIDQIGIIERPINSDVFAALIQSIVSQQISAAAALTVGNRLSALCGKITPSKISVLDIDEIQRCGMSARKAGYIKAAAQAAQAGQLDFSALPKLPDEQVIEQLTALPGVGVWTAEMLLIFSLQRRDVLSFGDLAIRRGLCRLYGHREITKELFARYKRRYSPYGSIASLYLWELSHQDSVKL